MAIEGPKRTGRRLVPVETINAHLMQSDVLSAGGIVSNVSECGACLITNAAISPGKRVRVKLSSPRRELFEVDAAVVWCREGIDRIKEIVGVLVGVSFVDVSPELRQVIRAALGSGSFQEVVPADDSNPDDAVHTPDPPLSEQPLPG